jgi:NAD+ synthase (glutamine-hydrolysing)
MKIALSQLNFHIGNFESNTSKIIANIERAKKEQVDLIIFPELAVCGYPPLDFLEIKDFIAQCEKHITEIALHCKGIAAIVGAPRVNPEVEGKYLYNSAFLMYDGDVQGITDKTLLPNYDVFDEYRYFESNRRFEVLHYQGKKIALTICEDLWDVEDDLMYVRWPMDELMKQSPDVIVNIAASPFSENHALNRKKVLQHNALKYHLPIFYVNHVGAQTELIFDGGSMMMNRDGKLLCELNYFEEDFRIFELDWVNTAKSFQIDADEKMFTENGVERIHKAILLGIKDYFRKQGFTKAILGLSGGVDSALVYALAVQALGAENVLGVLMPSPYSSDHSIDDSIALAKNLNSNYSILPISDAFEVAKKTLAKEFENTQENVAEENIQSRLRGLLLMAMSNKFGHILLNTSNKSELAVGYGTLYGDMCGGLSIIGDLYKTKVYELCAYINRYEEVIPNNILTKEPSAELRPDQKDSDSLPDYAILDQILFAYIEKQQGLESLIKMGFDEALIHKVLKMVNTNEYKRFQTPPILRVTTKAFGLGRRMPIVGRYW